MAAEAPPTSSESSAPAAALATGTLAGVAEVGGGARFPLGPLTPLAALAITVVVLNAIAAVNPDKGVWNTGGGYELTLFVITVALAVTTGPGRFSLDDAIGWAGEITGVSWAAGGRAAAVLASIVTRARPARPRATPRRAA